jgi:hypothetical protein
MNKLDNLILFLLTLSYILFDREGYIQWFYVIQLIFIAHYVLNIKKRKNILWKNTSQSLIINYFVFMVFCCISIIWSIDSIESFHKSRTILIISINSIILYDYLNKTKNAIKFIISAIIIGTYINFFIAINIFPDSSIYWDSWRFQGTRDNPNYLSVLQLTSIYFAILILKFNLFKSKIINWLTHLSIFLSCYLIILAASKKGLFLSCIFIIYYVYNHYLHNKNKIVSLITILLIILLIFKMNDLIFTLIKSEESYKVIYRMEEFFSGDGVSTIDRVNFIKVGFNNFINNPFIGTGIGSLKHKLGTYSHSNYIELISGLGIIGFFIYYNIYRIILKKIYKIKINSFRYLHLTFIASQMLLDVAQVTYYYKFSIFTIIVVTFIIENTDLINQRENKNEHIQDRRI